MATRAKKHNVLGHKALHYEGGDVPPVFRIDLSLPPSSRYVALAEQYCSRLRGLMQLFTWLLADAGIPTRLFSLVHRIAAVLLRRVNSSEEDLELQGISRVTQVPMYLLVLFNVFLDLLMGCTSGAVRSVEEGQPPVQSKMLHFRTLDWSMDPLREVVVQLEYVKSASQTPENVLATSLTYAGYVGVLTGVRRGLSMSLNFRPQHNASTFADHIKFYAHNLLVLLGRRQSISSLIRSYLIPDDETHSAEPLTLDCLAETLPSKASTAAYLIFSDGQSAITIEKDRVTGQVRRSRSLIVMTNHDLDYPTKTHGGKRSDNPSVLESAIAESVDRRACISEKWRDKVRKEQTKCIAAAEKSSIPSKSNAVPWSGPTTRRRLAEKNVRLKSSQKKSTKLLDAQIDGNDLEEGVSLTEVELQDWLTAWPTINECTHFGAILDPTEGEVVWARRYLTQVEPPPSVQNKSSLVAEHKTDSLNWLRKSSSRLKV
jgi:beta subunit of N-acylethanolamine-hydrolyzing acid amidase